MRRYNRVAMFPAAIGLLAACFATIDTAFPQETGWHIPSSAMGVVVVRPKEMVSKPGLEFVPHDLINVLRSGGLGFDPDQIETATGIVQTVRDFNGPPPGFALVLEFDSPQKPVEAIVANTEKIELKGRTLYRGLNQSIPSLLQLNDKTIIVGNEAFIYEMLSFRVADSPLLRLMKTQPSSGHLAAWVVINPVHELIKANLPPEAETPLPFQDFLKLSDLLNNISISVDLSGNISPKLEFGAVDSVAAKEAWGIMKRAISVDSDLMINQILEGMQIGDAEMKQAMQQYFQRMGDLVENGLEPEMQGDSLVFAADTENPATSVATFGVMMGLLLPAAQQVRETARRTQSMNNMKQLVLAIHNHDSALKKLPAQAIMSDGGQPLLSWRVQILPFLGEKELFDQFHQDEPWHSPHNKKLLDRMPAVYQNPNLPAGHDTVYLSFVGPKTAFVDGQVMQLREIRDGLSKTIAFVEADPEYAVPWTKPDDIEFDPDEPRAGIRGGRPGGFIAAMFDGSVRLINNNINDENTRNLIMPNDGKVVRIW